MKRTPLKRGAARLARRTPLRKVGRKMTRDRDELRETRRELLERSLGRCEAGFSLMCTGYGIHAHHVLRRSQGGHNDASNLLWCCAPCHDLIHAQPAEAVERGFLIRSGN